MKKDGVLDLQVFLAVFVIAFALGVFVDIDGPLKKKEPIIPTGQHMMLDLTGVESKFLQSEDRLVKAMIGAAEKLDLVLLSCNCHSSSKNSVSCSCVFPQAKISLHAWPETGVVVLDLFNEGSTSLVPAVNIFKEFFEMGEGVESFWSIDHRGDNDERFQPLSMDLLHSMIAKVKNEVLSMQTKNHQLDIWESKDIDSTIVYEDAILHKLKPGDPRWHTNELARVIKDIYIDGKGKTSDEGDNLVYQEFLIHPGMMAHPNPQHIAVVGDAFDSLRETLKHKVESVTLVQPDDVLVNTVREHVPSVFDCSDLVGRSENCLEDEVVTWAQDEGKEWFVGHGPENPLDVVFADATQPYMADALSTYIASVLQNMSAEGVLVIALGKGPTILHPKAREGYYSSRDILMKTLESFEDVAAMMVFEDSSTLDDTIGDVTPDSSMMACKSASCRQRFYAGPSEIDVQVKERTVSTKSKNPIFQYYDGVTHSQYQLAPKGYETVYCRREPMPFECAYRTLDFSKPMFEFDQDQEKSSFELRVDQGEHGEQSSETRVLTTVDIPKGSYIMAKDVARSLVLSQELIKESAGGEAFSNYLDAFGHSSSVPGYTVLDIGASHLIRTVVAREETNVGRWVPTHPEGKRPKYSPVYDNHSNSFDVFLVATRDIPKGTELLKLASM